MSETVELQVDGGNVSAGPQIATSFGPLGVNMGEIIKKINTKTQDFKGIKVPVKVFVNEDKSFEVEVGVPGASQLIKKEISLEKGSGKQALDKVGNLSIEQVIKIAKMKQQGMLTNNLKSAVNSIIGSCQSLGILVEGREAKDTNKDVLAGKYDKEIKEELTHTSIEKLSLMKEQLEQVKIELAKEAAKSIVEEEKKEVTTEVKAEEKKDETAKVEEKKDVKAAPVKEVKKEEKKEVKKK